MPELNRTPSSASSRRHSLATTASWFGVLKCRGIRNVVPPQVFERGRREDRRVHTACGGIMVRAALNANGFSVHMDCFRHRNRVMSLPLLKIGGGSDEILRTFTTEALRPSWWSRARRAVMKRGISQHPFSRRKPSTASSTPATTQRSGDSVWMSWHVVVPHGCPHDTPRGGCTSTDVLEA